MYIDVNTILKRSHTMYIDINTILKRSDKCLERKKQGAIEEARRGRLHPNWKEKDYIQAGCMKYITFIIA